MKSKEPSAVRQPPGFSVYMAAALFPLLLYPVPRALAQDLCGVATRVEFEDGGRGIGTIAEIGAKPPHVGWYRIVFSWNGPNGDWYSPKDWGMFVAGTKNRCGPGPVRNTPEPMKGAAAGGTQPQTKPASAGTVPVDCPMMEPPGKVTRTASASEELFKRVIYERAAAKVNPDSISAPKKIGLSFLKFELGEAYKNTLTSSRFGDKRKHDGAPVDAMIYPVNTKELQCDLHGSEVRRKVSEIGRDCFKNRDGDWTCPGRTAKVVEDKLVPLR
ncbi:MAG: hypothetical protein L6R30_24090 [Thermoanaerobaculia bacterium]|nr:hypothetical protein [Thermoanaerobaculia bacterium]